MSEKHEISILDSEGNEICLIEDPLATQVTEMGVELWIKDAIAEALLEGLSPVERLRKTVEMKIGRLSHFDLVDVVRHITDLEYALKIAQESNERLRAERDRRARNEHVVQRVVMGGEQHNIVKTEGN